MKLGESGEAFFVQEYEDDADELPANLTTSPLPTDQYAIKEVEEYVPFLSWIETFELLYD